MGNHQPVDVALTATGRDYLAQVRPALTLLMAVPQHRRPAQRTRKLRVSSPPTFTRVDNGSTTLPNDALTALAIASTGEVYVGFSGFSANNLWRTTDGGTTFTALGTGSLPSLPINDIVLHPSVSGWMYLATDLGIYVSEDGGVNWYASHEGPANVAVDDLWWAGGKLFAATHGRGIWVAREQSTIVVPDDFAVLQDAIDAAVDGDVGADAG